MVTDTSTVQSRPPSHRARADYVIFGFMITLAIAISDRARPKVQTIVAPVGRSSLKESRTPRSVTRAPMLQPMARRFPIDVAKSIAATEGTIRYEKTRRTPAIATDDVTTNPNDV